MSKGNADPQAIEIVLNADEALILFDFLSGRLDGEEAASGSAEFAVLASMLAQLERQLVSPFSANYVALLAEARRRLVGEDAG